MKCNVLPKMYVLADQKKQTNVHACFQFASKFKPYYMFCSCFELFILEVLNKPWGYHLFCQFSLVMLLCTVVVYVLAQSFLFGHIKSYLLKNQVSSRGRGSGWPFFGVWSRIRDQVDQVARGFSQPPFPDLYFSYFLEFFIFSRYGYIFHIFALW